MPSSEPNAHAGPRLERALEHDASLLRATADRQEAHAAEIAVLRLELGDASARLSRLTFELDRILADPEAQPTRIDIRRALGRCP